MLYKLQFEVKKVCYKGGVEILYFKVFFLKGIKAKQLSQGEKSKSSNQSQERSRSRSSSREKKLAGVAPDIIEEEEQALQYAEDSHPTECNIEMTEEAQEVEPAIS